MPNINPQPSTLNPDYIVDIGIECHVQLKTKSKLFCSCGNDSREAEPNTNVCPVCLGLPGTLPVLNKRAVELAIQAGMALNAEIATDTKFDRKNYFYPDLPKGYQITQFDQPIVGRGEIAIDHEDISMSVGITRAHLEEDAGKLTHPEGADYSLVDLNRAGTPLLEIVSEPDMHSPQEAKAYAQELYQRMRYAQVSDVDLYHGNMRFDLNISVRKADSTELGIRTEIKNLNSFRSIERAAIYEIKRQIKVNEEGGKITQETRGWDERKTYSMRTKEEAADYRYFPEPDIPLLKITPKMKTQAQDTLPVLVGDLRAQFSQAGLTQTQINAILGEPRLAYLLGEVVDTSTGQVETVANLLGGEAVRIVSEEDFAWEDFVLDSPRLIELAQMVEADKLSSTAAKTVMRIMLKDDRSAEDIATSEDLLQVSDSSELEAIVDRVITSHEKAAQDVRDGQMQAIGFLVGQVMKESKGQANPQMVQDILKEKLTQ